MVTLRLINEESLAVIVPCIVGQMLTLGQEILEDPLLNQSCLDNAPILTGPINGFKRAVFIFPIGIPKTGGMIKCRNKAYETLTINTLT